MPKIHINDEAYLKLKEMADEQNRSIANMAETIFYNVWGRQPIDPEVRKQAVDPLLKDPNITKASALFKGCSHELKASGKCNKKFCPNYGV